MLASAIRQRSIIIVVVLCRVSRFSRMQGCLHSYAPWILVASHAIRIFPRAHARGKGGGRREGKNTSGKMCKVFVPSAGMLAELIKFEHSK